jgi:poly(rC)-binding protein 3/4
MDVYLLVQNSDMLHSPAQDAVVRVYSRISEASIDRSSHTPARLLVPSQHIGCLLGKGGSIISEMRKITGANIRIFGNEQIPRCAQRNDEMVQVYCSCNKHLFFVLNPQKQRCTLCIVCYSCT